MKTSRLQDSLLYRLNKLSTKICGKPKFSYVYDYEKYTKKRLKDPLPAYKRYPCITPMWDNSCRRVDRSFFALKNSTPEKYKYWLVEAMKKFVPYSDEENLFFINAWNEWAEGNYLEPDSKWGHGYLQATKDAVDEISNVD